MATQKLIQMSTRPEDTSVAVDRGEEHNPSPMSIPQKKPSKFKAAMRALIFPVVYLGSQVAVAFVAILAIMMVAMVANPTWFETIMADATTFVGEILPIVSIAYSIVTILAAVITVVVQRKSVVRELDIPYPGIINLFLSLMLGIGLNLATSLSIEVLPIPQSLIDSYNTNVATNMFVGSPVMMFISMAVLIPIAEEVAFRMMPMRAMKRVFPSWVAAISSGILFAIVHLHPLQIMYVLPTGIILGFLFVWQGGWATVAAHIGYNGFSVLLMLIPEDAMAGVDMGMLRSPLMAWFSFVCVTGLLVYILHARRRPQVSTQASTSALCRPDGMEYLMGGPHRPAE